MLSIDCFLEESFARSSGPGKKLLEEFSESQQQMLPFTLARKLKAIGGESVDHKEAVWAFCQEVGENFDDFLEKFIGAYDEVMFPDYGQNGLEWAFQMALEAPMTMKEMPATENRHIVYSMCCYLGERNYPYPFLLAREPLSKLLGISKMGVSHIVKWLLTSKYIVEVGKYRPRVKAQAYSLLQ